MTRMCARERRRDMNSGGNKQRDTDRDRVREVERRIERRMREVFGYDVPEEAKGDERTLNTAGSFLRHPARPAYHALTVDGIRRMCQREAARRGDAREDDAEEEEEEEDDDDEEEEDDEDSSEEGEWSDGEGCREELRRKKECNERFQREHLNALRAPAPAHSHPQQQQQHHPPA